MHMTSEYRSPLRACLSHKLVGFAVLLLAMFAALLASPDLTVSAQAPPTVPGKPTGVKVTSGDTALTLTWEAPADDGGSPITGYIVEHWGCCDSSQEYRVTASDIIPVSSGRTYEITNLPNYWNRVVQVRAVNANGIGLPSDTVMKKPVAARAPSAPVLDSVTSGIGTLTANWTTPHG